MIKIRANLELCLYLNTSYTTQEILFQLHQKGIDTNKLKELLTRADLAKFAKAKPLQIENEESLKIGYDFIHQTKPQKEIDDVE